MKISLILLLTTTLNLLATGIYSQTARVSIHLNQTSIKQVLKEIEKSSEFYFLYNDNLVDVDRKVDIQVDNEQINTILNLLFENREIKYEVYDKQIVISPVQMSQQPKSQNNITGKITDSAGNTLPGVSVVVKGTTKGNISDQNGNYSLSNVPENSTLVYSFVGMKSFETVVGTKSTINVTLEEDAIGIEEVVAVGYGTQKKSDITGSVASVSKDKLEMLPNLNIAQAIQGAIPGVSVQQSQAGAASEASIMIRGRNSILASNDPLLVVDGIAYYGNINDINVNDVKSIEVLKDASSAAIYGSRGANGVILITTKTGAVGKPKIDYEGKFSLQNYINVPDYMNDGPRFYKFKETREGPGKFTASEQAVYDAGTWANYPDLALRQGNSQQHNLSVSGGSENTKYFIGGSFLDVQGLAINDDYKRITNRINIEAKIRDWLSIGTRTQLSYDDRSGVSPNFSSVYSYNPLTTPYDENGNLMIYPWPEYSDRPNPLSPILYDDVDKSYQVISNNFALIDFPFIPGLSYRLNTGVSINVNDLSTYAGRNTSVGLQAGGSTTVNRILGNNLTVENILSYNKDFGKHSIFATGLYSYEDNTMSSNALAASKFPNDFITYYAAAQAESIIPKFSYQNSTLISQMLRLNYDYGDGRYLLTLTGRRDGFSGFGAENKWGFFPSAAVGWNLAQEKFFPLKKSFDQLKLRFSYGTNGNQAVGAYKSITRMREQNFVSGSSTLPGYVPDVLGDTNLGWETSKSFNLGLDYKVLKGRIGGDINLYNTHTNDLLLNRTISLVHGISTITQNIGETKNTGIEIAIESRNIEGPAFTWTTSANLAIFKNEIVALYGLLNDQGEEIDDIGNKWFIGEPILVNYDYKFIGVWQLNEATEAAKWGSKPGYAKLEDVNKDGLISADKDRQILGQQDPKFIWGLNNSFSYKNFILAIFIHGVHGVTKLNAMLQDNSVGSETRGTTTEKNWWTPENPTNEYYMNAINADLMGGGRANFYQDASFVRIKDISLSYDFPRSLQSKLGLGKLRVFITGKNLATFSSWEDGDPELDEGRGSIPLQRELVFGLNLGF